MSYSLYDTIFLNTGNLITSTFRDDIVVLENTKETGTTDKDCRLVIRSNEDGESDIHLENLNGSTRNGWRIMNYTQGEYFSIGYRVGYTTSVSDYNFGWNEYLTVKNNGNVGIGTVSPTSTLQLGHTGTTTDTSLHVLAGDNNTATIAAYGSTEGTAQLYLGQSTSVGGGIVFNGDDNPNIFSTTDAVSFYRRYNGTDYTVFLYSYSSSIVSFTDRIRVGTGSTGLPPYSFINDTNTGMYNPSANELGFSTSGTERVRIDSSGRVGIGTTNPTSTLQVGYTTSTTDTSLLVLAGDSKTATIEAYGSTEGTARLYLGQYSTYGGGIVYNGDDNPNISSTTNTVSFYRRWNGSDMRYFTISITLLQLILQIPLE
jgi:hypothetical protein